MSADRKFLALGCVLLSLPIIFRVAPCAAVMLLTVLLAAAYVVVQPRNRR